MGRVLSHWWSCSQHVGGTSPFRPEVDTKTFPFSASQHRGFYRTTDDRAQFLEKGAEGPACQRGANCRELFCVGLRGYERSDSGRGVVRSYLGYYAGSHQNSAAKRPWARIVLPWVTRWEVLVSYPFLLLETRFRTGQKRACLDRNSGSGPRDLHAQSRVVA